MSLSLPAMGFAAGLVAEQRRRMTFRPLALRSLIGRSGGALLAIGAALAGAGVWALVAQQVASVALASLALWLFAARRPRFRFSSASFRGLVGFGVRTVATNLLFFSVPRIFVIGIGALLGTVAAGYVTLAGRCVDMLRDLAAGALLQLSLPVFSRLQDDAAGLERHYTAAVEITATAMFPVFVGLAVTAPETVALVFGTSWLPAAPYVALFALLTLHHFTRMFSAPLMAAVGRPHYSLASGAIQLLVVVAGLALVGGISLDAAMAVWTFRLLLRTPADMALLRRASGIGLWRQLAGAAPPLLLALAMAAIVLAVRALLPALPLAVGLAALVAAGVAAYLLLLAIFRRALVWQVLGLAAAAFRPAGRRASD
jgi:PST family polysaccharide transporter